MPSAYLLRALQRRLDGLRRHAQRLAAGAASGGEDCEGFWDIISASVEGEAQLRSYLQERIQKQRAIHGQCVEHAVLQAASLGNARDVARLQVQEKIGAARATAVKTLEPLAISLERQHATYQRELRAAGISNDWAADCQ